MTRKPAKRFITMAVKVRQWSLMHLVLYIHIQQIQEHYNVRSWNHMQPEKRPPQPASQERNKRIDMTNNMGSCKELPRREEIWAPNVYLTNMKDSYYRKVQKQLRMAIWIRMCTFQYQVETTKVQMELDIDQMSVQEP